MNIKVRLTKQNQEYLAATIALAYYHNPNTVWNLYCDGPDTDKEVTHSTHYIPIFNRILKEIQDSIHDAELLYEVLEGYGAGDAITDPGYWVIADLVSQIANP